LPRPSALTSAPFKLVCRKEGGVFIRFVRDYFDDLPARTVFAQEQPEMRKPARTRVLVYRLQSPMVD